MTTLVEIRCRIRDCGRLLDEVIDAPADRSALWSHYARVHLCPRHGEGAGYGNVSAWQARQQRLGKPTDKVQVGKWICWEELRGAVEKARRTGKTQKHFR